MSARSSVAKTDLMADGFKRFAACHSAIKTSPRPAEARNWLVTAMMTTSGLAAL